MFKVGGLGKIGKKKIIVFLVVVLLLVAGGVFWWWQGREIKGSPADYDIKETEEGKFVENKKAGLVVRTPEGWEAEKMGIEEGMVMFYSSNTEVKRRDNLIIPPLKKGCVIRTTVVYKEMDFAQIKKEVSYTHFTFGKKYEEFEEIIINNHPALKSTFDTQDMGSGIEVYIPKQNRIYGFFLMWASDDKETCVQDFDKFLETVSINPD